MKHEDHNSLATCRNVASRQISTTNLVNKNPSFNINQLKRNITREPSNTFSDRPSIKDPSYYRKVCQQKEIKKFRLPKCVNISKPLSDGNIDFDHI